MVVDLTLMEQAALLWLFCCFRRVEGFCVQ